MAQGFKRLSVIRQLLLSPFSRENGLGLLFYKIFDLFYPIQFRRERPQLIWFVEAMRSTASTNHKDSQIVPFCASMKS